MRGREVRKEIKKEKKQEKGMEEVEEVIVIVIPYHLSLSMKKMTMMLRTMMMMM